MTKRIKFTSDFSICLDDKGIKVTDFAKGSVEELPDKKADICINCGVAKQVNGKGKKETKVNGPEEVQGSDAEDKETSVEEIAIEKIPKERGRKKGR